MGQVVNILETKYRKFPIRMTLSLLSTHHIFYRQSFLIVYDHFSATRLFVQTDILRDMFKPVTPFSFILRNLTSLLLSFLDLFDSLHAQMFKNLRPSNIDQSALLLCCKHISTIIAITFGPVELSSCVITHLKARNPLYKDHVGFLKWGLLVKWWVFPGHW